MGIKEKINRVINKIRDNAYKEIDKEDFINLDDYVNELEDISKSSSDSKIEQYNGIINIGDNNINMISNNKSSSFEEIQDIEELSEEDYEKLFKEEDIDEENFEENDDLEEKIIQAKTLPEGWNWRKYDDGSGELESPNGNIYMEYDLMTNEYKETPESSWEYFPLEYYYADGEKADNFDAFQYMEKEVKEQYVEKDNVKEEDYEL